MEPVYPLVRNIVIPLLRSWFRWSVEGVGNIPPAGPAILAFNHISYLDPFAAAYVVDQAGRRPRFLAKSELFEDRRISWILRGCRQIEVRRGTPSAPLALEKAIEALESGEIIVIFPEGTVTTDPDLWPMAAKTGAVRLAIRSGAPLIPGAIWGTTNVLPKGNAYRPRLRRGQDICVRVGAPMDVSGRADTPEDWRALGLQLMDQISTLVASLRPAIPDRRRPTGESVA